MVNFIRKDTTSWREGRGGRVGGVREWARYVVGGEEVGQPMVSLKNQRRQTSPLTCCGQSGAAIVIASQKSK